MNVTKTDDEIPNLGYTISNKKLLSTGFTFLYNLEDGIKEIKDIKKVAVGNRQQTVGSKQQAGAGAGKISMISLCGGIWKTYCSLQIIIYKYFRQSTKGGEKQPRRGDIQVEINDQ